jgi:hypothetical protein
MGPAFYSETLDRVGWFGGGFQNYFTSYEGMRAEAQAAKAAAQSAADGAAAAVSEAQITGEMFIADGYIHEHQYIRPLFALG